MLSNHVEVAEDMVSALENAAVVILPMPGTNAEGYIKTVHSRQTLQLNSQLMSRIPEGTPVLVGVAQKCLKQWATEFALNLVEIAEDDELAILNSIPTAEGAVALAMNEASITIHGSTAMVLGLGRVGLTLARLLKAMGADTWVAARRAPALARAYELGCKAIDISRLKQSLSKMDFVFNTIPHLILGNEELKLLPESAIIIDLATAPGGVDFTCARELGLKAVFAPGLPGKVAPKTAGEILSRVIPRIISETLP